MKISYNWLQQYVQFDKSPEELSKTLTNTGLEVEGLEKYESIKGALNGVVIGEVKTCSKHPNADKLSLTTVDIGESAVPIVCGAPNVAVGQKVVVATIGSMLYPSEGDVFKIKKSKIRGEVSEGMLCAEDELGLGQGHDGILVLETNLSNGTPASEYFKVEKDHIFEIGLTPNRVDAASHYGVARDIKAVLGKEIKSPDLSSFKVSSNLSAKTKVEIINTDACSRYSAVSISNISVEQSPQWLKNKLTSIGVKSINNVVDVTNYVLHSLGQPLHAFDADKINGNIVNVKNLPNGTPFTTLDGSEIKLTENDLVICDDIGPLCLAGVIGGATSGVSGETKNIFLESAYFKADYVRKTSMTHGIKTDSSFRFERGTDPNSTVDALKLAAILITELANGEVSSEIIDIYPNEIVDSKISIKYSNVNRLIGKDLGKETIKTILKGLEISIDQEDDNTLELSIPAYRIDVKREADVIEEILRIYGYDNIELSEHLGSDSLAHFPDNDEETLVQRASEMMVGSGFSEILSSSLTTSKYVDQTKTGKTEEHIEILNKLSEDLGVMRQSMLFSGLEVIAYNINRKQRNLKLFDFGNIHWKRNGHYEQTKRLALFITGNEHKESWIIANKSSNFYDISEIVSKLLRRFGIKKVEQRTSSNEAFDYGLDLLVDNQVIASFGKVDATTTKLLDVKSEVFFADIDWAWLGKNFSGAVTAKEISKFPEVRRDLSLVLDKKITFDEINELALKTERKLLKNLNVFSIYEGENIEKGKKSYAISFLLHDNEKTLSDKIIDKTMNKLINIFEKELNALIRK